MFWFLFFCLLHHAISFNILLINSLPSYSHFSLLHSLAQELSKRDHQITLVTPFPWNETDAKIEHLFVEDLFDRVTQYVPYLVKNHMTDGPFQTFLGGCEVGSEVVEDTLKSRPLQRLLQSNRRFDLVVVGHYFNDVFVGLRHLFQAPVVFLSPVGPGIRNNFIFGNSEPWFYVPNVYGSFRNTESFWERVKSTVLTMTFKFLRDFYYLPKQKKIFQKFFNSNFKLDDVSLMICNSLTGDTRPQTPTIVNVAGFFINPPQKLPQVLQEYLDQATNGAILFSLGSIIESQYLDPDTKRNILSAFSKLKQKVLWKHETVLTDLPSNVKIVNWLPQQAVLAHPNIRAFVTQGGVSSLLETVYFAVPAVGIPVFTDQHSNIEEAVSRGYAFKVSLLNLTEDSFLQGLQEVIYNPKYKVNVVKLSRVMRDQPIEPLESVIYWLDYVVRYKGASHLRGSWE